AACPRHRPLPGRCRLAQAGLGPGARYPLPAGGPGRAHRQLHPRPDARERPMSAPLRFTPEVRDALQDRRAVVALETTAIAHGLPYPDNLALAGRQMAAIRAEGAVPAVIGLWDGEIAIGLDDAQLEAFAQGRDFAKVSRRDLAAVLTRREPGATTVAGT